MNEVEAVTDNDERELLGEMGLLQEVLDFFAIIKI